MALVPFPTDADEITEAIADLKASASGAQDETDNRLLQLGQSSAIEIERYAPDAPSAVKDECVRRMVGWYIQREPVQTRLVNIGGAVSLSQYGSSPNALKSSGAAMALAPWKRRRALPVQDLDE